MPKFRLQPVLKLRQHREEQRKRELAEALAVERRLKDDALRLAQLRQAQAEQSRRRQKEGLLDIRAIIEVRTFIGLLDRRIHEQLCRVAGAEHESALRRAVLVRAMKDRKALDVLRQRAMLAQRLEEARRETAELDEVGGRRFAAAGADL